ncbi:MAG: 5-deoxy-glucuronate isomerase, partial [Bacteroidota bacterium]
MVTPKTIGETLKVAGSKSPAERAYDGRAVVPGHEAVRTVELFDATPALNAREEVVTADNGSLRFLRFARIALDAEAAGYAPVTVRLGADEEALFYVNRGEARLGVAGETHVLGKGDVLYVGLGEAVEVATGAQADVSEFRAVDCSTKHPVQLVRHTDIEGTELAANVGSKRPMTTRTVFKLVDQNVQACRLLFGDTYMAQAGGVGSYPPHFHGPDGPAGLGANAKEEIYHFRVASDIPGDTPYVLQNVARPPETVNTYVHVFDEQAINVTPSFHDTMAPPSVDFMFTWCLGSFTEGHRDWAEIHNKPGYDEEW